MHQTRRNPASLAAGRASEVSGLAAERAEDTQAPLRIQASIVAVAKFDYGDLAPEVASMARQTAAAIREAHQRQVAEVIATGEALIKVKVLLPHGEFGRWLESEFGWSARSAENYMRVAETYGPTAQRVAHLPLGVVFRLAAPTIPTEVREDVLLRADRGERPTERAVGDLIRDARAKKAQDALVAERDAAQAAAQAAKKERGTKAYRQQRDAALAEQARRAKVEQEAQAEAAAAAVALIHEHMDQQRVTKLVALINRATAWKFLNALKSKPSIDEADVSDDSQRGRLQ